jgi:hypothetical protein
MLYKMATPKRLFRIGKDNLQLLAETYKISDMETGNSTSTFIWKYWHKSFKTGTFEITRTGLLREATWARKNGFTEWSELVSTWADLAVPI